MGKTPYMRTRFSELEKRDSGYYDDTYEEYYGLSEEEFKARVDYVFEKLDRFIDRTINVASKKFHPVIFTVNPNDLDEELYKTIERISNF